MELESVNENVTGEYRMELANENGAGERNWNVEYQLKRVHHWATVLASHASAVGSNT